VIESNDRIELAPGVVLRADALHDSVRGIRVPLNASARLAFRSGATVGELAASLARLGARDADHDAAAFAAQLNRLLLANLRTSSRTSLVRRVRALRKGKALRPPTRRIAIDKPWKFVAALMPSAGAVVAVLLPLVSLGGAWTIAPAFAAGAGIVVHEAAHAVALCGVPRALVLEGLKPSILHPPLGAWRTFAAAVAGPLAPTFLGLSIAMAWRGAAPAAVPLAAHVVGLTVIAPDGRAACGLP
jgi:hypothetical protein